MEGFNQGYAEGSAKAELEMKELMEQATLQASELLQLAHQAKEDLIQEAEPFWWSSAADSGESTGSSAYDRT